MMFPRVLCGCVLGFSALVLAGCGSSAPRQNAPVAVQKFAPQAGGGASYAQSSSVAVYNDPPAPPNTPICSMALQQANLAAAIVRPDTTGNDCVRYACYSTLTNTYIGADGFNHVCR